MGAERRNRHNGRVHSVLQLTRKLAEKPVIWAIPGIRVRHFVEWADVTPWLDLRNRAFAKQRLGVRQWTAGDFAAEFTTRWWWQPEHCWLAEACGKGSDPLADERKPPIIGSVTLAMRGDRDSSGPAVHWLMVLPDYRRSGIARLLMAHLEAAAWELGHREVVLETHAAWGAAAKFYAALGYV